MNEVEKLLQKLKKNRGGGGQGECEQRFKVLGQVQY